MDDAQTNLDEIGAWYSWFANNEANGQSELWADLASRIANDSDLLHFLASFPSSKRQPNLFLASYRSLFGTPEDWATFRGMVLSEPNRIAARMLERSTQTNEPGRCAVLLPVLATLPQPLALVEVGASAGLCLLLDRYGYDYGGYQLTPPDRGDAPLFECDADPNTPIPQKLPDVAWRMGLDINPLDVMNHEQMAWLETLVWPGQEVRRNRLRKAIAVAQRDPPQVIRGDIANDLKALMEQVPTGLTTVIFHSAVLNYLPNQESRDSFADQAMTLADYWISNESPMVLPQIATQTPDGVAGSFLLSLNAEPIAWTNPHGSSIRWIAES